MKLLADENIPLGSVLYLKRMNYDIVSILEKSPGITDEEVIEYSNRSERIIITLDKDFGSLFFKKNIKIKSGIIYIKMTPLYPTEIGELLGDYFGKDADMYGYFIVFDRYSVRKRKL